MSILTFLGRDSGFGEKNNSAYVEIDNSLLLIDCGFTVFKDVVKKFDLKKYDSIKIIVTHLHNDHAGSLSQLILYIFFVLNKRAIILSKCKHIKEYLNITGTLEDAYEIIDNLPYLEFIKTEHVPSIDAYGFKLTIFNKNIIYTGDTNTLVPFLPYLNNCDEFYVDVSRFGGVHLKIDDIIPELKALKENSVNVYLMHMDDKEYIKNVTNNEFNC